MKLMKLMKLKLSNVSQLANIDPHFFGRSCTALLMHLSVFLKRAIFFFVEEGPTILHVTHVIFPGNLKVFHYLDKIPQRQTPDT